MTAVAGDDPAYQSSPIGFFAPGTPLASDVGLNVFPRTARHGEGQG